MSNYKPHWSDNIFAAARKERRLRMEIFDAWAKKWWDGDQWTQEQLAILNSQRPKDQPNRQ